MSQTNFIGARVTDDLAEQVRLIAACEGESVSDALRRFLEAYVATYAAPLRSNAGAPPPQSERAPAAEPTEVADEGRQPS